MKRGITPEQAEKLRLEKGKGKETNLKRVRLSRGLSQVRLAKEAGVSLAIIASYEQGKRNIDGSGLDMLCRICKVLDCRIEEIIESEELKKRYRRVK